MLRTKLPVIGKIKIWCHRKMNYCLGEIGISLSAKYKVCSAHFEKEDKIDIWESDTGSSKYSVNSCSKITINYVHIYKYYILIRGLNIMPSSSSPAIPNIILSMLVSYSLIML